MKVTKTKHIGNGVYEVTESEGSFLFMRHAAAFADHTDAVSIRLEIPTEEIYDHVMKMFRAVSNRSPIIYSDLRPLVHWRINKQEIISAMERAVDRGVAKADASGWVVVRSAANG